MSFQYFETKQFMTSRTAYVRSSNKTRGHVARYNPEKWSTMTHRIKSFQENKFFGWCNDYVKKIWLKIKTHNFDHASYLWPPSRNWILRLAPCFDTTLHIFGRYQCHVLEVKWSKRMTLGRLFSKCPTTDWQRHPSSYVSHRSKKKHSKFDVKMTAINITTRWQYYRFYKTVAPRQSGKQK